MLPGTGGAMFGFVRSGGRADVSAVPASKEAECFRILSWCINPPTATAQCVVGRDCSTACIREQKQYNGWSGDVHTDGLDVFGYEMEKGMQGKQRNGLDEGKGLTESFCRSFVRAKREEARTPDPSRSAEQASTPFLCNLPPHQMRYTNGALTLPAAATMLLLAGLQQTHAAPSCSWPGHCLGAVCQTWDDCSDDLTCTNGRCAVPAHAMPGPSSVGTRRPEFPAAPVWATGYALEKLAGGVLRQTFTGPPEAAGFGGRKQVQEWNADGTTGAGWAVALAPDEGEELGVAEDEEQGDYEELGDEELGVAEDEEQGDYEELGDEELGDEELGPAEDEDW
ncbi:MAG: hypothetical protein SGCHY_002237 [Lobulomycetales sp.]